MTTTNKTVTIIINVSTNPSIDGKYFADFRDTAAQTEHLHQKLIDPRHAPQMTTRTLDAEPLKSFIDAFVKRAPEFGITVTVVDETKELGY